MDPEWCGPGWYRPGEGNSWREATGETKWIPCGANDIYGRPFKNYQIFKQTKRDLRLRDRLDAIHDSKPE
jgi:hypothetical protein